MTSNNLCYNDLTIMNSLTLNEFYSIINHSRDYKYSYVAAFFNGTTNKIKCLENLRTTLYQLESLPKYGDYYRVSLNDFDFIDLNLHYEIGELKKDILFLEHDQEALMDYLSSINKQFASDIKNGEDFLKDKTDLNFITDRDGTINNYCGRYLSSIQSIYNAVFLTRFFQNHCRNAIILTSAPLSNKGLIDISVFPADTVIYAGSKGREFLNAGQSITTFPIKSEKQHILNTLNDSIEQLLKRPDFQIFQLIGSGFQKKFGQSTIAFQDINSTIHNQSSDHFKSTIKSLVTKIDPYNKSFRLEDTGLDLEIILTLENNDKDFDKGDGVKFLNHSLNLRMEQYNNVIAGDTAADLRMLEYAVSLNKRSSGIFVTENSQLEDAIKKITPNYLMLHSPDALVSLLAIKSARN